MKIKCETCRSFKGECIEFYEDKKFCLEHKFLVWTPRDRTYCLDCPLHYFDNKKRVCCARHSEPCFKNWNFLIEENWEEFKVEYKERIKNLCKNFGSCQKAINQEEQEKEVKKY